MSTFQVLQHLYSLDTSSPDFLRFLYCLIRNDEEDRYLTTLQGSELTRLVDFFDDILDVVPMSDDVSRRCLHKLRTICSHHAILPSSYTISGDLTQVGDDPVADGGFSDVWKGTYNGHKVCIKNLRVSEQVRQAVEKAFYKEAIIWKKLRHPNIVAFIGVTRNRLQFVSGWMPNGTLTDYIKENPDTNRVGLLLDVAEGLAYLHANHIMHGDLKGPNILVDHSGHACLTDFGFASVIRGLSSVLVTEVQGYTARWAAPEVLKNGDRCTREADVFAFGMVVVEVFTGKSPFSEVSAIIAIVKIIENEWPDRPQEPGLTDSVWDMTCACWSQDPVLRPQMTKVVEVLRECYRPHAANLYLSSLSRPQREKRALGTRNLGYSSMPLGLSSAYQSINKIAEVAPLIISPPILTILFKELAYREDGPGGEQYKQLLELCTRWDAVPASYEISDVVAQGDRAQHISGVTEIWKGIYDGEVVAMKVLRLSRDGGVLMHNGSGPSEDDVDIKMAKQRFCATAVFMKQTKHDNIIPFYGLSTTISDFSLVFPWYKNGNIKQYLEKNPGVDRYDLSLGAISGLLFLHSNEVAHGALQLGHILIDDEGNARLTMAAHNIKTPLDTENTWGLTKRMGDDVRRMALITYEVLTGIAPHRDYPDFVPEFGAPGFTPLRPRDVLDDLVWGLLVKCWKEVDYSRPRIVEVYRTLKSRPKIIHTPWMPSTIGELPRALELHVYGFELEPFGCEQFRGEICVKLKYGNRDYTTSPTDSTTLPDGRTWRSPENWVIETDERFPEQMVSLEVIIQADQRKKERDIVVATGNLSLIESINRHCVVALRKKPFFQHQGPARLRIVVVAR